MFKWLRKWRPDSRFWAERANDKGVRVLVAAFRAGAMGPTSALDAVDRFGGVARLVEELSKCVLTCHVATVGLFENFSGFDLVAHFSDAQPTAPVVDKEKLTGAVSTEHLFAMSEFIWAEFCCEIWGHAELWSKSDPQAFVDALFEHSAREARTNDAAREEFASAVGELVPYFREIERDENMEDAVKMASRCSRAFQRRGCDDGTLPWAFALAPVRLAAAEFNRAALEAAGAVDKYGKAIG